VAALAAAAVDEVADQDDLACEADQAA